jgi:hypothetical protein
MSETQDKAPKLVAGEPTNKTRMIKIRAIRDCQIDRDTVLAAGDTAEVPENMATEFCKPFDSYWGPGGEWSDQAAHKDREPIRRAMVVQ